MIYAIRTPDGRTLNMQADNPQQAAQAARLVLARQAIQQRTAALPKQNAFDAASDAAANSFTLGLGHLANAGIDAGITALGNAVTRAQGGTPAYGAADAFKAARLEQQAQAAAHPTASTWGGLLGGLAFGGEAGAGKFLAGQTPALAAAASKVPGVGGLLARLAPVAETGARAVPLAATQGAISGGANAALNQQNVATGALKGAAGGAGGALAAAGAAPILGYGAGKLVRGGTGAAQAVVRAANRIPGIEGSLVSPQQGALNALRQSLKADKASPADITAVTNEWLRSGSSSPALLDVLQRLPNGGTNTLRLVTGASLRGGANAAKQYVGDLVGNLQGAVQNRTQQLIGGDARQIPQVQQGIEQGIQTAATLGAQVIPGDPGAAIHGRLNAAYDSAKATENGAWTAARQTKGTAGFAPDQAQPLSQELQTRLDTNFGDLAPQARTILNKIQGHLASAMPEGIPPMPAEFQGGPGVPGMDPARWARIAKANGLTTTGKPASLDPLWDARTQLGNLQRGGGVEGAAASQLKDVLDAHLNNAVDNNLIVGNPDSVAAYQHAIDTTRGVKQAFESGDLIDRLVNREYRGGSLTNTVAPEDASNTILGSISGGVSAKPNQIRDLTRIRDMMGAGSPEWGAIQGEASDRLLGPQTNPDTFGQAFDRFRQQNPQLGDLLVPQGTAADVAARQGQIAAGQGQQAAIGAGQDALSALPPQFQAGLPTDPGNLDLSRLAAVRDIQGQVGRPAEGATGLLNRIGARQGNAGANLSSLFGPDEAGSYQQAVRNETDRVNMARLIDPDKNSATFRRFDALADPNLGFSLPKSPLSAAGVAVRAIRRGAALTDAEQDAITRMATSQAGPGGDFGGLRPEDLQYNTPLSDFISQYARYMPAASAGMNQGQ